MSEWSYKRCSKWSPLTSWHNRTLFSKLLTTFLLMMMSLPIYFLDVDGDSAMTRMNNPRILSLNLASNMTVVVSHTEKTDQENGFLNKTFFPLNSVHCHMSRFSCLFFPLFHLRFQFLPSFSASFSSFVPLRDFTLFLFIICLPLAVHPVLSFLFPSRSKRTAWPCSRKKCRSNGERRRKLLLEWDLQWHHFTLFLPPSQNHLLSWWFLSYSLSLSLPA